MNNRTRLPLPEPAKPPCPRCNGWNEKWEGTYAADQMHAYSDAECAPLMEEIEALRQDGSKLTAENAALRERLLKMSDTMKGMDAHEAGLSEAQAYLMARVKVLEDALRECRESVSVWDVHSIARAALEAK